MRSGTDTRCMADQAVSEVVSTNANSAVSTATGPPRLRAAPDVELGGSAGDVELGGSAGGGTPDEAAPGGGIGKGGDAGKGGDTGALNGASERLHGCALGPRRPQLCAVPKREGTPGRKVAGQLCRLLGRRGRPGSRAAPSKSRSSRHLDGQTRRESATLAAPRCGYPAARRGPGSRKQSPAA